MIILGIDPGLQKSGWGVLYFNESACTEGIDINKKKHNSFLRYVDCGIIKTNSSDTLQYRITILKAGIEGLILTFKPDIVVLEETFANRNAFSSLRLGIARGAIMLAIAENGIDQFSYLPQVVRKTISGDGRIDKRAVCKILNGIIFMMPAVLKHADSSDAMAVVLCYIMKNYNFKI